MLNALSSAVSGLDSFQQDMDVIGNNIANINTDGFKAGMVNFADTFSDTLVAGTGTVQIGTGVYDQAITNNWSQGAVNATITGISPELKPADYGDLFDRIRAGVDHGHMEHRAGTDVSIAGCGRIEWKGVGESRRSNQWRQWLGEFCGYDDWKCSAILSGEYLFE